jgi:hypothetical protein
LKKNTHWSIFWKQSEVLSTSYFVSDCIGKEAENAAAGLNRPGFIIGKLTFHSEEEAGDVALQTTSSTRRYYVNDALEQRTERMFRLPLLHSFLKTKNARITIG